MSTASVQFTEMIRIEHARIELLKAKTSERGEFIINVTAAVLSGEITQEQGDDLIAAALKAGQG